jgi:hypothetical protein
MRQLLSILFLLALVGESRAAGDFDNNKRKISTVWILSGYFYNCTSIFAD